jgi:hypothetical protein
MSASRRPWHFLIGFVVPEMTVNLTPLAPTQRSYSKVNSSSSRALATCPGSSSVERRPWHWAVLLLFEIETRQRMGGPRRVCQCRRRRRRRCLPTFQLVEFLEWAKAPWPLALSSACLQLRQGASRSGWRAAEATFAKRTGEGQRRRDAAAPNNHPPSPRVQSVATRRNEVARYLSAAASGFDEGFFPLGIAAGHHVIASNPLMT